MDLILRVQESLSHMKAGDKEVVEAQNELDRRGFELVGLHIACVEVMGQKNVSCDQLFHREVRGSRFPLGSSCESFDRILHGRLWPHIFHLNIPGVHIIDFDIKQGVQWSGLFQSLASRSNPPSHVKITGIGELIETGDRLAGLVGELNLPFEFHLMVDRLEDVRLWVLHLKEGECVAVNCVLRLLHRTLHDTTGGTLKDFLRVIRSTNPAILVTAEHEASHNSPILEEFSTWRKREKIQDQMLLKIYRNADYSITEQDRAALTINWQGQPLYTISAWEPPPAEGHFFVILATKVIVPSDTDFNSS